MRRVGFACLWDPDPAATWSGTPWRLQQALAAHADVVDLGPHLPAATRLTLRALYARRRAGRWVSPWKHGRIRDVLTERRLGRAVRATGVDAVVQVQDLAVLEVPSWVVQDLSYDALLDLADDGVLELQFPGMSTGWLERRRDRQHAVYAAAAGLLPMSAWLARHLVERSGVPADRVTVVRPGTNVTGRGRGPRDVSDGPGRLLFVGRDFHRKGGDAVVDALVHLRASYDPGLRLTVCGPTHWPLDRPPPDGVDFVGSRPPAEVSALYESHDLFVLPSRFEAFGIVFLEALAHGLPCIGRDAYAMPELVHPGVNGALVRGDDPGELAAAIVDVLEDRPLRQRVGADRERVADEHSWDRSAERLLAAIDQRR